MTGHEISDKFRELESRIAEEEGSFVLFALFMREDAPDRWDLIVSAPWITGDKRDAVDYFVNQIKSQLGEGTVLPQKGVLFVSVKDSDKPQIVEPVRQLIAQGFRVIATGGTQIYLVEAGLPVERVNKVAEGRPHIVDKIVDGEVALIFNTTEGWQSHKDSQSIRASALGAKVPYYTTAAASAAVAQAISCVEPSELEVRSLQDYYSR